MTYLGTRPPTVDEWEKYELHHRSRMSTKPGITGMFKEKPTQEVAKEYIEKGALWNGGVFAFRLGYVLERAHELIDFLDYDDLFCKYETLKKISFDYVY